MSELLGRDREFSELNELWASARRGSGRIAVVTAEAGGGKTAILRAFTDGIAERDAILWGDCLDGEAALPYWPWLSVLKGTAAGESLLQSSDSEAVRFQHFRAVADHIAALTSPRLVVIDDLHWADGATLRLLEFLAPAIRSAPLLLFVAARPTPSPDVQAALGTLLRYGAVQISLRPLRPAEVDALLAANGQLPDAGLTRTTGGNPLLVKEYARHLSQGGERTKAPGSLQALLHAELRRLSPESRALAGVASLVGGLLLPQILLEAARATPRELEQLVSAGLLVESAGVIEWRHDAFREAIRDGLAGSTRLAHEAALAGAFEAAGAEPEMAVHGCRAGSAWKPDRAHAAAVRLARRWAQSFVLELATDYASLARSVRPLVRLEPFERLDIEFFEGDVFTKAGRQDEAREIFRGAARLARELHRPDVLAGIALSFGLGHEHGNARDDEALGLLREALDGAERDSHALRARLLSRLAWQALASGEVEPRRQLSEEALREARMAEDPAALATALMARCWALARPDDLEELRRASEAATTAARDSGDIELQLGALFRGFLTTLTFGELSAARTTAQAFDALTQRYPLPYHRWYASLWNGLLALAAGKLVPAQAFVDEIEPEATTQRELAALNRDTLQAEIWNAQGGDLRIRGVGELRDAVDREIGLGWVFAPRFAALTEGREAALALLRPAMRRFGTLEIDEDWLPIASELAAAAVSCGATEESAEMFRILLPYAGRWIVIANGASCRGPVSSFLAALARVAGMTTEAEAFRAEAKSAIEREQAPGLAFWMDLAPVGADPPPRRPGGLTVREAEVLALVARGHSNQEIADALFLSVRTIQRHVENVYGRLGLHNRANAALAAVELGLVSAGDVRAGEGG